MALSYEKRIQCIEEKIKEHDIFKYDKEEREYIETIHKLCSLATTKELEELIELLSDYTNKETECNDLLKTLFLKYNLD